MSEARAASLLRVRHLSKTFADGTPALSGVSLDVARGEFVVVLGPSGSGKTTLVRCINGLLAPSAGEIAIDGEAVVPANLGRVRRRIGTIFQNFNLIDNLSTLNNVLTGLLDGTATLPSLVYLFRRDQKLAALECLDRVGILPKAYARADRLSGGQRQRVGIARAIVKNPLLLLADEPVASLDPLIAFNVMALLKDINVGQGITVVCNLHQVDLALRFADRIVGLAEGRVVLDRPSAGIDERYVQSIYRGRDRGLYYGHEEARPRADQDIHFAP